MDTAIQTMNTANRAILIKLLNTVYYFHKSKDPFTYLPLLDLQIKNGSDLIDKLHIWSGLQKVFIRIESTKLIIFIFFFSSESICLSICVCVCKAVRERV